MTRLYTEIWGKAHDEFEERLNSSLKPHDFDALYESFGRLEIGPDSLVLDIGCRDASGAVQISRRFGCRSIGVDPIPGHIEWAEKHIADNEAGNRVSVRPGRIEAIPLPDASVDFVWARDMISHVDLARGLAECWRVLRPAGSMLVYQAFATERMSPEEAARMYRALAIVPENMEAAFFENAARQAGFEITRTENIGTEWREAALEDVDGPSEIAKSLLRVSRLLRQRDDLVHRFGSELVETAYWGDLWSPYILIGKLCPVIYVLSRTSVESLFRAPGFRTEITARTGPGVPKPAAQHRSP